MGDDAKHRHRNTRIRLRYRCVVGVSGVGALVRPKALDLFCGAGGAGMGLHRAGFDVVGVDIRPQPRYPFAFVQADALRPPFDLADFDLIWASPPCQAFSALRHLHPDKEYQDLIHATRVLIGGHALTVIENVSGAPLKDAFMLCGSSFGLAVRRHRFFETSFPILTMQCAHPLQGRPISVSGTGGRRVNCRPDNKGGNTNAARSIREAQEAIGIHWATRYEISQAIPPAYSEFIGREALRQLAAEAA